MTENKGVIVMPFVETKGLDGQRASIYAINVKYERTKKWKSIYNITITKI